MINGDVAKGNKDGTLSGSIESRKSPTKDYTKLTDVSGPAKKTHIKYLEGKVYKGT